MSHTMRQKQRKNGNKRSTPHILLTGRENLSVQRSGLRLGASHPLTEGSGATLAPPLPAWTIVAPIVWIDATEVRPIRRAAATDDRFYPEHQAVVYGASTPIRRACRLIRSILLNI